MATTVGIIRAIGVVTVQPSYLETPISLDDIDLDCRIDTQVRLRNKIETEVILDGKITKT